MTLTKVIISRDKLMQYIHEDTDLLNGLQDDLSEMFDLTRREIIIFLPLVILTIFIGLYPKPIINIIEPSTEKIVNQIKMKLD